MSFRSKFNRRPAIHRVGDAYTTYVGGRRLMSADAAAFSIDRIDALMARRPVVEMRLGGALLAKDLLAEPIVNLLGGAFAPLVPRGRFGSVFAVAAAAALAFVIAADHSSIAIASDRGFLHGTAVNVTALLTILGWHEIGHMAAARRCGIRADSLGLGTYFILPALFTRISMLALLSRRDRVVVLLSGVFFQSLLGIAIGIVHACWPDPLSTRLLQLNLAVASLNLLPFLRLDGHHVAAELVGMLDDEGRSPWVGICYRRVIAAANVAMACYLAWIWIGLADRVTMERSPADLGYFAFVTVVCGAVAYGAARRAIRIAPWISRRLRLRFDHDAVDQRTGSIISKDSRR